MILISASFRPSSFPSSAIKSPVVKINFSSFMLSMSHIFILETTTSKFEEFVENYDYLSFSTHLHIRCPIIQRTIRHTCRISDRQRLFCTYIAHFLNHNCHQLIRIYRIHMADIVGKHLCIHRHIYHIIVPRSSACMYTSRQEHYTNYLQRRNLSIRTFCNRIVNQRKNLSCSVHIASLPCSLHT